MPENDSPPPRRLTAASAAASAAASDLQRRIERLEDGYDGLGRTVGRLENQIEKVATEQLHQREVWDLRFKGLESNTNLTSQEVKAIHDLLEAALRDPSSVIPGQKQIMQDWQDWRKAVNEDRETIDSFMDRINGMTTLAKFMLGTSALSLAVAIWSVVH